MSNFDDFGKFARSKKGVSSLSLHKYASISSSYISPYHHRGATAEHRNNGRLLAPYDGQDNLPGFADIDDYVANIIQAQLLYLDSTDPGKIYRSTSTTPEEWFMPDSEFMTQCST
jgi:ATP-dependent Clp protease, protease subunit